MSLPWPHEQSLSLSPSSILDFISFVAFITVKMSFSVSFTVSVSPPLWFPSGQAMSSLLWTLGPRHGGTVCGWGRGV